MSYSNYKVERTLAKDLVNKKISGVCAGIARYFDLPRMGVRAAAIVLGFIMPLTALVAYFVAALVMPNRH